MCRWVALVIWAVLYKNISTEPIPANGNNDRFPRQLVFEESCPCAEFDKSLSRRDARYDDTVAASAESDFLRARDVDDCPCRLREADSQGASSLLFPNAMRAAGNFLRPVEKKEELKPFFTPEVDLASSVLETLRIATDEEYHDALARDAAKIEARAVEDIMYGDTSPQESANVVTVLVDPNAEDFDNIVPQASHIKQSRCIHSLGRASKPILNTPRLLNNLRPRILDRNAYYLDSDIGASSIHENIKPFNEQESTEFLSNRLDLKTKANVESDNSDPMLNKIKLIRSGSSLLQSIRNKTRNSLLKMPKLNSQGPVPEKSLNDNVDLSPASSLIQEQAIKRIPLQNSNSKYENIKRNSRPLTLTNLLNLKDVELVPLKDLINKQAKINILKKPQGSYITGHNEYDDVLPNENQAKVTESLETTPLPSFIMVEDSVGDAESSPTRINLHIASNDIESSCLSKKEPTEIRDDWPDTKDALKVATVIESNENIDKDSMTDASNMDSIITQGELNPSKDYITQSLTEQEEHSNNTYNNPETKPLDILSLDKTISKISNYILKKQEDLNNLKSNLLNKTDNSNDRLNNKLKVLTRQKENHNDEDSTKSNFNKSLEAISLLNEDDENKSLSKNEDTEDAVILEPETSPSLENSQVTGNDAMSSQYAISDNINEASSRENLEKLPADNDGSEAILRNDTSCFEDQDSEDSNNSDNISDQSELRLSVNEEGTADNSASQIIRDSNELTNIKNPVQQILRSNTIEKAMSTINNFILKKQEDLRNIRNDVRNRNIFNKNIEDEMDMRNEDQNFENQSSLQVTTMQNNIYNNLEMLTTTVPKLPNMLKDITTTSKPYISSHEVDNNTGENTDVSMQDLQKISDSMLQQEEAEAKNIQRINSLTENWHPISVRHDLDSTNTLMKVIATPENFGSIQANTNRLSFDPVDANVEASDTVISIIPDENNFMGEMSTPGPVTSLLKNPLRHISDAFNMPQRDLFPVVDEVKEKLMNWVDKKERNVENSLPETRSKGFDSQRLDHRSSDEQGLDNSAELQTKFVSEPENLSRFQEKSNEIENCKTELASRQTDSNPDASDTVVSIIPSKSKFLGIQITPSPAVNLLKNSLTDIRNGLNLPQAKNAVDEINSKLKKLFDTTSSEVKDTSRTAIPSQLESLDTLNTVMSSDASTPRFQLKKISEGLNLDQLKSNLQSNVLRSFPKLTDKDFNLKPLTLKSSLLDKRGDIFQSGHRQVNNLHDILNLSPSLHDLTDRLIDGPNKAFDNFQSTLKNTKNSFESKLRALNNNNFNTLRSSAKSPSSLFDTFSQNTEDLNDKLKAIHIDLNDRLETMRNSLIDGSNLLTTGLTTIRPNFRSASNSQKQNKSKQPKQSRTKNKESPNFTPKKKAPVNITSPPKPLEQKKFKMPAAASVPVPKTVQVPVLKATPAKSPPLTLQKSSSYIPIEKSSVYQGRAKNFGELDTVRQPSFLRRNSNMKKDNNIKISISTTPWPATLNTHKSRSSLPQSVGTSRGKFDSKKKMYEDYSVSPSELQETRIAPHNYDSQDVHRSSNTENNNDLLSSRLVLPATDYAKEYKTSLSKSNNLGPSQLHTALRATESEISSKIKDALRTRLARVNSAKPLQKSNIAVAEARKQEELSALTSEMAQSASENKEIIDQSMKENVSYKCKMICSKE